MDTTAVARSMRSSIGMLAMDWLMAPSTVAGAIERGLPEGTAGYDVGRLGVLGDVPPDNVVAAAFFWQPDTMRAAAVAGKAAIAPAAPGRLCTCPGTARRRAIGSTSQRAMRSGWLPGGAGTTSCSDFSGGAASAVVPRSAHGSAGARSRACRKRRRRG